MPSRLWGLTRRQTIALLGAALVVGVIVAVVLDARTDTDTTTGPTPLSVERLDVGTRASPHALWVFGFQTLRFDRRLRRAHQLGVTGFGSVVGQNGRVYMYDAGTGRVGVLETSRNTLERLGTIPPGTAQPSSFVSTVAASDGTLWLVSAPGEVTRFDVDSRSADPPVRLDPDATHTALASGIIATDRTVVAATQEATSIVVTRLDPTTGAITAAGHLALGGPTTLDGLATDGAHIWIVAGDTAYDLDATTLSLARSITVGGPSRAAKGALIVGDALWMLADNGATLARVDRTTGDATAAMRILTHRPSTFRAPASLVTDGTRIYAMVQATDEPDNHRVRLVGYRSDTSTATRGIDLPSSLFAGAAAIT